MNPESIPGQIIFEEGIFPRIIAVPGNGVREN